MRATRGRLLYDAAHGATRAEKDAARAELRRLDEQRRAETEAADRDAEQRREEERRARIYFPAEDVPAPPRESVKKRGADLYEHLYVENRGRFH
ncbi:hypothetical protein [Janibacter indicus]|uniref:hypothetical protein n=1 Tax=Janibacter indicus TaxID=857417 RepID=UPI003EB6FB02